MNIEVLHHGAITGVTGSCHQYISETANLLIDCGLFQGKEADKDLAHFPFDITRLDALIITHGHIDHIGRIPWLIAAGFRGPIYCTKPTAALLPVILHDALEIHIRQDAALVDSVTKRIKNQIIGIDYDAWFTPESQASSAQPHATVRTRLRFQQAGHILGSAYVEIDHDNHRTVFSGDLGSPGAVFVEPPCSPERADTLVIETTYGDKHHTHRSAREQFLARLINKALEDNGTLLIPAFSLGRTQELLSIIENLLHNGKLSWNSDNYPDTQGNALPIILDSPLASELTEVYRSLADYWPEEIAERKTHGRRPLAFENLITVESHSEHTRLVKRLAKTEQPAIVIAASGMCQGGRIVNYLKSLLPLHSTDVLFAGYQARGTLGNQLQSAKPGSSVWIDQHPVTVNCKVYSISGFSAHADQADLLKFIEGIATPPAEIRLVHGDQHAKNTFARLIEQRRIKSTVIIPA
jgi:metallo-beta-lactamase family protein